MHSAKHIKENIVPLFVVHNLSCHIKGVSQSCITGNLCSHSFMGAKGRVAWCSVGI